MKPNQIPFLCEIIGIVTQPTDIEGSGFNGSQKIILAIDNNVIQTEPLEIMADEAGNFSAKFTLSEGQEGEPEITARDELGNKALGSLSVKRDFSIALLIPLCNVFEVWVAP